MNDYCRARLHFPFVDTDIPNFVASTVTARFYIYLRTTNTTRDLSVFLLSLFILLCNCFNSSGSVFPSVSSFLRAIMMSLKQTHYIYCHSGLNMN